MPILFICCFFFFAIPFSSAQFFGGWNNDYGTAFCQGSDGYFLTGTTRSFGAGSDDIWMIKVNNEFEDDFHVEWGSARFDIGVDIIATSDQHYVLTGHSWDAPGGRSSILLAKYDASGTLAWISYFGSWHNDYVYSVKEAADGGYIITGLDYAQGNLGAVFMIKTTVNGNVEWERFYNTPYKDIGMDLVEASDSSIMLLANTNSFIGKVSNSSEYLSPDPSKIMLIKTDKNGNELWRKFFGGLKHDFGRKIVTDGNDNFYFIGSSMTNSNGSYDITLHKVDAAGNLIWRKNYGGAGYEYGNDLAINDAGELLLTGTSSSFSTDESSDIYVLKVDSDGTEIWSNTYGGTAADYGNGGEFLDGGAIGIIGSSKSGSGDDSDLFFTQLDADGNILKNLNVNNNINGLPSPTIFPNPTSTYININSYQKFLPSSYHFTLFDMTGKILQEETFREPLKTIVFKQALAPGIYGYQLKTETKTYAGKLIINR